MAANDLMAELQKDSVSIDEPTERKIVAAVLKLLEDKNAEVQNIASKCLASLARRVRDAQLEEILQKLCLLLAQKQEELRDIAGVGLKAVIAELPQSAAPSIKLLIPRLVIQLKPDSHEVTLATLDILCEVLTRFGPVLSTSPQLQSSLQSALLPLLNHTRLAVRKRATAAIGSLVIHLSDELFNELVSQLYLELKAKEKARDFDKLRTLIGCISTISRFSAQRLSSFMNELLTLTMEYTKFDDDELREYCLQALETFTLRCPTEVGPHMAAIVAVATELVKHDPNYQDDEEADDDEAMDVDGEGSAMEEDEEEEDDADYSDDEDMSWKVRRASTKLITAIITASEVQEYLYSDVAPLLIQRFKERVEGVRVEIISTFLVLVRQTGIVAGVTTKANQGLKIETTKEPVILPGVFNPLEQLRALVPKLSRNLSKQLNSKSIPTRQAGFTLLRELIVVMPGCLGNQIGLLIAPIESSLSPSGSKAAPTNPPLKIEVLTFLRVLFMTHVPECFHKHMDRIVPPVVACTSDKYYKIVSGALVVIVQLVRVIRPIENPAPGAKLHIVGVSTEFQRFINRIFDVTIDRLKASDVDLEVKERSIVALGKVVAQCGDLVDGAKISGVVYPLLVERMRNELTRLTTVKVIRHIGQSALFDDENGAGKNIEFDESVLVAVVSDLSSYLRKAQRQLRVAALQCLETLVKYFGSRLHASSYVEVLGDVKPLILDSDLHIFPLAMQLVIGVIAASNGAPEVIDNVRGDVVPQLARLIVETPHLVGSGPGLEALVAFWRALVSAGGQVVYKETVGMLVERASAVGTPPSSRGKTSGLSSGVSKQAFGTIAQSIAVLALHSEGDATFTVSRFLEQVVDPNTVESSKYLALLTIGEIGRRIDLSVSHPKLDETVLELFQSPSEELKHAAAFTLGNLALGNIPHYMPGIIQHLRSGTKPVRYLLFTSLKEIITRQITQAAALAKSTGSPVDELWTLLFVNVAETVTGEEEGTRNVIAECVGKLAILDPWKFVPGLVSKVKDSDAVVRATVVAAVRYTFVDSAAGAAAAAAAAGSGNGETKSYDELLEPLIGDFLALVTDSDLNVRKVSLATLNSAAHNKPNLIRNKLDELLPLLYAETVVNQALIRFVEMGPFKHRVDDGLEARKSAYECMYTLLDTCLSRIEINGFLQRVIDGLADPAQEIQQLAHLMLQRVSYLVPNTVAHKLDDVVDPLVATLAVKLKGNAVKQEVEKRAELVRSVVRTIVVLMRLNAEGSGFVVSAPKFEELVKKVRGVGGAAGADGVDWSAVVEAYGNVVGEVEAQQGGQGGVAGAGVSIAGAFSMVQGSTSGGGADEANECMWPIRSADANGVVPMDL
ncbi:armadillo-type protein [Cladochytrium replicatum]|nr:armadillo-type protein [Cladochytrium replicatum]